MREQEESIAKNASCIAQTRGSGIHDGDAEGELEGERAVWRENKVAVGKHADLRRQTTLRNRA